MTLIYLFDIAEEITNSQNTDNHLQYGSIRNKLRTRLHEAALSGELVCYDSCGKYKPKLHDTPAAISTTKEAINAYFKASESPYRYNSILVMDNTKTGINKLRDDDFLAWRKEEPDINLENMKKEDVYNSLSKREERLNKTTLNKTTKLWVSGFDGWVKHTKLYTGKKGRKGG